MCPPLESIATESTRVSIRLKPEALLADKLSVINALAWLSKAIRIPSPEYRFAVSSSTCRIVHYAFEDRVDDSQDSFRKFGLNICFSPQLQPLIEVEHNCWQPLFESCIVIDSEELKETESFGKGLEVSFE